MRRGILFAIKCIDPLVGIIVEKVVDAVEQGRRRAREKRFIQKLGDIRTEALLERLREEVRNAEF